MILNTTDMCPVRDHLFVLNELVESQSWALDGNNRLVQNYDGTFYLAPKSPAYVVGECVLRPLIDSVSRVWHSCAARLALASVVSLLVNHPMPLAIVSLSYLDGAVAMPLNIRLA